DEKERKAIAQHAVKSEAEARLNAMVNLAQVLCPVVPEQLDADPWLLNVENGTIDLRTGKLRPHRRQDLSTKLCPVIYDPQASCPTWEEFLEVILNGKQDVLDYVWKAIGYSLTGSDQEQCIFLAYGTGSNGKSTLLDILRSLLADYSEQAEFSTFVHK